MRLWALIKKFQKLDIPYIVENVQPYYKAPIQPTLLMGRHCFWSNKPIISCKIQNLPKKFDRMSYSDWEKYHDIKPGITEHIKEKLVRRQHLRNMVHWTISYQVIRQILFPKQKQLEVI